MSTVYLIHFDEPLGNERHQAQHYIGCASNLEKRIEKHKSGNGSKIMAEVARRGIGWQVIKTWVGTKELERRLKRQKHAWRHCEICRERRRYATE